MNLTGDQVKQLVRELAVLGLDRAEVRKVLVAATLPADHDGKSWAEIFAYAAHTSYQEPQLVDEIARQPWAPGWLKDLLPPAPTGGMHPHSIHCDRRPQWEKLVELGRQPRDHLVLLGGRREEAHEYFIQRLLKAEEYFAFPVASLDAADWLERVPAELPQAFLPPGWQRPTEATLSATLVAMTRRRPVVIVNPLADLPSDAGRVALLSVPLGALARQLAATPGRTGTPVIVVQPLRWKRGLIGRIFKKDEDERDDENARVRAVGDGFAAATAFTPLPLLDRITEDDLRVHVANRLAEEDYDHLVTLVRRRKTTREILGELDRKLFKSEARGRDGR